MVVTVFKLWQKLQSKKRKLSSPGRKISILDKFILSHSNRIIVTKEFWRRVKSYCCVKKSQNLRNCFGFNQHFLSSQKWI